MKKSIKNTIMVGMAAVLIGTSAITFSYTQINDRQNQIPFSASQFDGNQMQGNNRADMPEFTNTQKGTADLDNNTQDKNAQQTPPNQNEQNTPQQGEQPQQGAENQNTPQQGEQNQTDDGNNNKQSVSLQSDSSESGQLPNLPQNFDKSKMPSRGNSKITSIVCFAFLGVQLAIILMIIAYLFVSKFNRLSFNQVFPEKKVEQAQTQTTN